MGSADSQPVRNMDKRTARREYRSQFENACDHYREVNAHLMTRGSSDPPADISKESKIRVYSRKRPIFKREIDDGEFDCVTCLDDGIIVVHDARMKNDMIHMMMKHNEFKFYHTFNENATNENVYDHSVSSIVKNAVLEQSHSTCMVYGQTGSGVWYGVVCSDFCTL